MSKAFLRDTMIPHNSAMDFAAARESTAKNNSTDEFGSVHSYN